MSEIAFTSALGPEHKDELERLLFFNHNQTKVAQSVTLLAERYGVPRIQIVAERLRIELDSAPAQSLFAVRGIGHGATPVGVVVYTREEDALVVLFMAVHEDFSTGGPMADQRLLLHMTSEVRAIARRVRGVSAVLLHVGRSKPLRLAADRGPWARVRR